MGDFKVEVGKVKKPASLTTIQVLGAAEEGEVFVICEDLDGKRGSPKVLTPCLEGTNDSEQFAIVDVVIALRRDERLGEVRTRVPVSVRVGLEKNCSSSVVRGICGDGKRGREVWEAEDWFGEE